MGYESITDQKIDELLELPKSVTNPKAREMTKGLHLQQNFTVKSASGQEFTLYLRQNNVIADDFSCGLLWHMPSGESLTIVRYNGSSHFHPNRLEETEIDFDCHIHKATQRYIESGLKPEGFATVSTKYSTLNGALHCLVTDCNITGLPTTPENNDLFK